MSAIIENIPSFIFGVIFTTCLSVIASLIVYIITLKKIKPVYDTQMFELISNSISKIEGLTLLFDEEPIQELSTTRIYFWNDGRKPIRETDIVKMKPFKIAFSEKNRLLNSEMIYPDEDKNINNFQIVKDENETQAVTLSFDHISKNDCLILQFYHTKPELPKVDGLLIDNIELKRKKIRVTEEDLFLYRQASTAIYIIGIIITMFCFEALITSQIFSFFGPILALAILILYFYLITPNKIVAWLYRIPNPVNDNYYKWKIINFEDELEDEEEDAP